MKLELTRIIQGCAQYMSLFSQYVQNLNNWYTLWINKCDSLSYDGRLRGILLPLRQQQKIIQLTPLTPSIIRNAIWLS